MKFFQEASTAWWDRQLRRGRITAAWNVMEGIMSKGRFSAFFVAAVAGIGVYVGTPALAVTLDATRFGIYENFGAGANDFSHSPDTGQLKRYDVGSSFSDGTTTILQRDYFVFNLAGVTGTVTGATLSIFSPSHPTQTNASDTLVISDVTTPVNTLIGNAEGVGAYGSEFADLANGTQYGSVLLNPATIQVGTQIDISLGNALGDINAHQGGLFAVGGTISGIPGNLISGGGPYYLSPGTFAPFAQLTLQTSTTSVPEPTSLLLLGAGLVGLAAWRLTKSA